MAVLAALSNICLAEDLSKKLENDWAKSWRHYYASVGGATGHTVVGLCMYVCMYVCICLSVCRQDFSSLAEN